jgi:SHS2 domain-containing protein
MGRKPSYEFLDHTSDAKFCARGDTIEEAFCNAALALASLMWDWTAVEPKDSVPVRVQGRDHEQLLVKFLDEVIYLKETRRFLLGRVRGLDIEAGPGGLTLIGELLGDEISDRYEIHGDVKAATYHEMKIARDGGFSVHVVVDM